MGMIEQESIVLIVGAGPAGLATSACLNLQNIPNIVLEKEDCYASLWKKRSYDRLRLHLAKQFCELPNMPFPPNAPTFVPKRDFISYMDDYVSRFNVAPLYHRCVVRATFDLSNWVVVVKNTLLGTTEKYVAKFLVVATGENSKGYIPQVPGLDSFNGEVLHSSHYKNGKRFDGSDVLVVGSGNSGMEIALDLSNWGARTSLVVRGPVHFLTDWMVKHGMELLTKDTPVDLVDKIVLMLSEFWYGDLSEYGIERPSEGPFLLKRAIGRSPVIDVGTIDKIRSGEIKVFSSVEKVNGDYVHFANGDAESFDVIVFATGYKSTVREWLKDGGGLFGEDGMPRKVTKSERVGKERTGFIVLDLQCRAWLGLQRMQKLYQMIYINNFIKYRRLRFYSDA